MAETANAQDDDGVASVRAAVAQGVEGGDAGAQQRCGIDVAKVVGDEGDGVGGGDYVVGIATIVVDTGDLLVFAKHEVAAAAGLAVVAMAAMPAEANALAGLEDGNVGSDGIEYAGDFVAGNARKLDAGPHAQLGERIAVADPAGLNTNAYVSWTRLGELSLN